MHDTAYEIGRQFLEHYGRANQFILELGSYNINGSLRDFCPEGAVYLGLDVEKGPSVDILVQGGKPLPLRDEFADIILSSSVFEHDQFFWETFLELMRVLKPGGYFYLSAPSNGTYHRYPIDCWRFYPDSGKAFESLAQKQGYALRLIESFIAERRHDQWNDCVAIFAKGPVFDSVETKFLSDLIPCRNITQFGSKALICESADTEDQAIIRRLTAEVALLKDDASQSKREAEEFATTLRAQLSQKENQISTLNERVAVLERQVRESEAKNDLSVKKAISRKT